MARGNAPQARVHYQGKTDDFIVYIDDKEAAQKWKEDKTIPLAQIVGSFKVFITHKQGDQGILDGASNATLDNEFGTHNEDEVVQQILQNGTIKESDGQERSGSTNDTKGGRVAH